MGRRGREENDADFVPEHEQLKKLVGFRITLEDYGQLTAIASERGLTPITFSRELILRELRTLSSK